MRKRTRQVPGTTLSQLQLWAPSLCEGTRLSGSSHPGALRQGDKECINEAVNSEAAAVNTWNADLYSDLVGS
ncbi:hypothetical protein O3P69_000232 [Scylla paramamosain]|uniref:Uncharacterized protein n=1 Tax=Scylla paramamosain TaxID=85552 RepID=A0AAW0UZK1_SCYPA